MVFCYMNIIKGVTYGYGNAYHKSTVYHKKTLLYEHNYYPNHSVQSFKIKV